MINYLSKTLYYAVLVYIFYIIKYLGLGIIYLVSVPISIKLGIDAKILKILKTLNKLSIMEKKIIIILASNKKEAKEIASKNYEGAIYEKPYRYASKGNNFYQFFLKP